MLSHWPRAYPSFVVIVQVGGTPSLFGLLLLHTTPYTTQFMSQGRLAAIICYTWRGVPGKLDPMAVFRCGALTDAGKSALSPC